MPTIIIINEINKEPTYLCIELWHIVPTSEKLRKYTNCNNTRYIPDRNNNIEYSLNSFLFLTTYRYTKI